MKLLSYEWIAYNSCCWDKVGDCAVVRKEEKTRLR